ncbi:MAG: AAA family ATPase [Bacteroidia bacterium]
MKQDIGIGFSDFKKLREGNYYYIDKTLFIKNVMHSGEVILCTRPRRFGKTLTLSMLQYFFDISQNNHSLFEGLAITQEPEYEKYAGKHPVIFVSLKGIKDNTWADAYENYQYILIELYNSHHYLLTSNKLSKDDKKSFQNILSRKASQQAYAKAIYFLSELLYRHHNQKVIILIDEYDSPIYPAYLNKFYKEAIGFLRTLMESALKDNKFLEKGVVSGILRIVKESLFSGLNNPQISSILNIDEFSDKIGFTETETFKMLDDYDLSDKKTDVKYWYDGYLFGKISIYNPWSILNYVTNNEEGFKPYWVNTSDNALLRKLLLTGESNLREEINDLMEGKKLVRSLPEEITFSSLDNDKDAVFALLHSAGYLNAKLLPKPPEVRHLEYEVSIPNEEVISSYEKTIKYWLFEDLNVKNNNYEKMLQYLMQGHYEPFEMFFERFFEQTVSTHDTKEGQTEVFYHALFLGMVAQLGHLYIIKSNAETGYGRYNICMIPKKNSKYQKGILIEIKLVRKENAYLTALAAAEEQMNLNKYQTELDAHGITEVFKLCIAAKGKEFQMKEIG